VVNDRQLGVHSTRSMIMTPNRTWSP
jgi:hypothetical protein